MTREETIKAILSSNGNILLELPTSYGKSKIALDIIASTHCSAKISANKQLEGRDQKMEYVSHSRICYLCIFAQKSR